ncbi:adenosine deaminase [Amnibacterium flavum]|uniref:adenosine deaminase n=1 Tax=Amnibacterium flavum TaxID=2173173 RepID=A0A2V1HTA5_9MICO|nr:adenosine deaminase [Amnibacterium flavum]PVZ95825.1 adenosine deaminase [Amnibacterium flavum]
MSAGEKFLIAGGRVDIADLPKVSLHDHLDGGLRPETIVELAEEAGVELPAPDAASLGEWFRDSADSGSLESYLDTFAVTISVMQTRQALSRVAREFVVDLATDGVIYGEVRWAPEQHLERGLSLDDAVEAVQEGIEQGIEDARRTTGHDIRVSQILSAMRQADRSLEIAELAVRWRGRGVVAFDIAGPEEGFPPSRMLDAFDYLAEEWFPVTVHAGEDGGIESIRGALLDGRALRIGHGVGIAHDIDFEGEDDETQFVSLGTISQWVKDREVALELAPSSNLQTGAISHWGEDLADHPFDLLYQLGFRVTVNTDNRLMSGTSITQELSLLRDAFGYDLSDFEVFQLNAAAASFLSVEDREDLADRISDGFDAAGR